MNPLDREGILENVLIDKTTLTVSLRRSVRTGPDTYLTVETSEAVSVVPADGRSMTFKDMREVSVVLAPKMFAKLAVDQYAAGTWNEEQMRGFVARARMAYGPKAEETRGQERDRSDLRRDEYPDGRADDGSGVGARVSEGEADRVPAEAEPVGGTLSEAVTGDQHGAPAPSGGAAGGEGGGSLGAVGGVPPADS